MQDPSLRLVTRPARYTGGEWNAVPGNWEAAGVRIALAFPDIYEVGMSNMAVPILYDLLNNLDGVLAERVYAPWVDMEQQLRAGGRSLTSLETRHPLKDFDIIGFTLGYELGYTTVLNMLDLAGIPVFSSERDDGHPLVMAGGSCAMNPEPMADFVDLFFIGEAEEALPGLIDAYRTRKGDRGKLLANLAQLPGVYVPRFYHPEYHKDGTLESLKPVAGGAPAMIERAVSGRLYPVTRPVVPYIEVIHDRGAVEIQRGCSRGCRFCQAGVLYRPVRELAEDQVLDSIDSIVQNCGYNSFSLVSLSSGDYSNINHLVQSISARFSQDGFTLSLPSLRLDRSSIDLIDSLPAGRKTTLTFAPEAGSDRLRRAINKWIPQEAMMDAFSAAFEKNWMNLKLYFMIGLPTETVDDVSAIGDLLDSIVRLGKGIRNRPPRIRVSVSSFIPKPHTPCQWTAQETADLLNRKHQMLQDRFRRSSVQLSWHDTGTSLLEAALARGDRRLGRVIFTAWKKGCRLDTWSELLDVERWQQAFAECGVDPAFYAQRSRPRDELLPWQHISSGVSTAFLLKEQDRMEAGELTADCRTAECSLCGLQGKQPACRARARLKT